MLRPGFPQDYREYRKQPWFPQLLATTSHIRFWADWPTLQPQRQRRVRRSGAATDHGKLLGLDEQIRLANAGRPQVILLPYRYPLWVNGTELNSRSARDNFFYMPAGSGRASTWRNWYLDAEQLRPRR